MLIMGSIHSNMQYLPMIFQNFRKIVLKFEASTHIQRVNKAYLIIKMTLFLLQVKVLIGFSNLKYWNTMVNRFSRVLFWKNVQKYMAVFPGCYRQIWDIPHGWL